MNISNENNSFAYNHWGAASDCDFNFDGVGMVGTLA